MSTSTCDFLRRVLRSRRVSFTGSVVDGDLAQCEALTREIGSPTLVADMFRLRGLYKLFGLETPDFDGARRDCVEALEIVTAAGSDASLIDMQIALAAMLGVNPKPRSPFVVRSPTPTRCATGW